MYDIPSGRVSEKREGGRDPPYFMSLSVKSSSSNVVELDEDEEELILTKGKKREVCMCQSVKGRIERRRPTK